MDETVGRDQSPAAELVSKARITEESGGVVGRTRIRGVDVMNEKLRSRGD